MDLLFSFTIFNDPDTERAKLEMPTHVSNVADDLCDCPVQPR